MGKAFSMRWLNEGSVKLSKTAPKALHELVSLVLLGRSRSPRREASGLPRGFKPANETSVNEHGVERDQIWQSLDPRDLVDGQPRQVRVLVIGAEKALVENLFTGNQTAIALKRFCGKTKKGFKLVVPKPVRFMTPLRAEA